MSLCPNKNLPEWKALVERVGEFEAYRDYLENNHEIRDADTVEAKIQRRADTVGQNQVKEAYNSDSIQDIYNADAQIDIAVDAATTENIIGLAIAKKLSNQLGIGFEIITAEQAMELTKDSNTPYTIMLEQSKLKHEMPPAAFFHEGSVYFVGDNISAGTAIHEFSHPLIRAIQKDRPELFEKMYNKLISDKPGMVQKLADKRPDLEVGSDLFKEEMLVMALTDAALKLAKGEVLDGKTKSWVNNLMYAIKQLLRKLFGKVPVSKLDPNTTLEELAAMLVQGGKFEINVDSVSQEDVTAYLTDINELAAEAEKVEGRAIHEYLDKANAIVETTEKMLKAERFEELRASLIDNFGQYDLQELKATVKDFKNTVKKRAQGILPETKDDINTAKAFAKTLTVLETMLTHVVEHMEDIEDSERSSIDNMQKFFYYEDFVKYWANFIEEISEGVRSARKKGMRIDRKAPLMTLLADLEGLVKDINNISQRVRAEGARDGLYEQLEPMGRDLADKYKGIIKSLEEQNAPKSQIDKWHRLYYGMTSDEFQIFDKLRKKRRSGQKLTLTEERRFDELLRLNRDGVEISPEKIEGLLKGNLGDANWLNSFLEGYLYNNDAVIGGLALYVKEGLNQVMVNAQSKFNDFADDLKDDLEKIGYNPTNVGQLGEEMGFRDAVGKIDENGEVIRREVYALLQPFGNGWRFDLFELQKARDKAEIEFVETGSDKARQNYLRLTQELRKHKRNYMNQPYVKEVYAAEELLEKDDIGMYAFQERQSVLDEIRSIDETPVTEENYKELQRQKELALRKYRQLGSAKRLDGTPKKGLELEVALRIKEHREATRKFYTWKEKKGAFQRALFQYEKELEDAKITRGSDKFIRMRQAWIDRNTRFAIKPEYYDRRGELLERKKQILSKLSDSDQRAVDNVAIREEILDMTAGFRDDDGQIKAEELNPKVIADIKKLEEESLQKSQNYVTKSGLTPVEHQRLSELFEIENRSPIEQDEMNALFAKMQLEGLTENEIAELEGINNELKELSTSIASDYYVDHMDELMKDLDLEIVKNKTGVNGISVENANEILDEDIVENLVSQNNEQFNKWFYDNHVSYEYYSKEKGAKVTGWRRLPVWSVVRPTNPKYIETTTLKDETGEPIGEPIIGLPKLEFFKREVKPEYRTGYNPETGEVELIVGKHINNKGEFLPLSLEDGALDGKYINREYETMKRERPDHFRVLEKLTKHHLANQEGASYKSKLYLDFPRFSITQDSGGRLEMLQKGRSGLTSLIKRIRNFYRVQADDFEKGLNNNDRWNLTKADIFDDEVSGVPIRGLYDIDIDDVSTDITHSMMRYMFSLEHQKELLRRSPLARSIQDIVNDPKNKIKSDQINKWNFINRGVITYLNKKGKNVRSAAVNNFIEREFEGKNIKGFGSDVPWLLNTSNAMFKLASYQFFALNIPSAMKNAWSAKFQGMIEAAAGKYYNLGDFERGNRWAYKAMIDLSFGGNLYAKGHKSLIQQIVEIYDPSQGRFEEKFGESMSRSLAKDAASGTWLYNFRKWVELQATLQIFGGMMNHKTVLRYEGTEKEEKIRMVDAWELRNGKIQLKEGIDPEEGITYDKDGNLKMGKKFNAYKNKIQMVMNNLQGAYARFDQPEAQRFLAFRMISFLRKYLTPMLVNRFGFKGNVFKGTASMRLNPGLGEGHMGYYIQTIEVLKETIKEGGANLPFLQTDEKAALLRTTAEIVGLVLLSIAARLLFGWDPDDEDRYEKLRDKSGSLPFWGVRDDEREFNLRGYLENHMLLLLMNVKAENEQFIPLPGLGFTQYKEMMDVKSVALSPTLKTYMTIIEDILMLTTGDERAYYKRDAGPYIWQGQDSAKITNRLMKIIGLTGGTVDPALAIKNLQSIRGRR